MRKVFLEDLPKRGKGQTDWKKCMGKTVKFIYDDIVDSIEIVDYIEEVHPKIILKYGDFIFNEKPISTDGLKLCKLGYYLNKNTEEFKIKIGTHIKDDFRDLNIIGKKHIMNKNGQNHKYYKYSCNKCGWNEGWMVESSLLGREFGCPCCSGKIAVLGINTIWDTDRWVYYLGVSEEDAKKYTKGSGQKIEVACPHCGSKKRMCISKIIGRKSISCPCGDGFSYPEKFMNSMLKQLDVEFETQYCPDYLIPKEGKRYRKRSDFYIPSLKLVIEIDGRLGHDGGITHSKSNKTLEECITVDKWKDEQHILNGINVIRINCFVSDMDYIKSSILNSELIKYFNMKHIEWLECDKFALKNIVKEVCVAWNNKKPEETTINIGNMFGMSGNTVNKYLKSGLEHKWCDYDSQKELKKARKKAVETSVRLSEKMVEIFKDGVSLGLFRSATELERQSEIIFGLKLLQGNISAVCRGEKPLYKGYIFKYVYS